MIIPEYWCFNYEDSLKYILKMKDILLRGNKIGVRYMTHKLIVYELPGNSLQLKECDIWEFITDSITGMQHIKPIKDGLYKYTPYITEEMINQINEDNQQLSYLF